MERKRWRQSQKHSGIYIKKIRNYFNFARNFVQGKRMLLYINQDMFLKTMNINNLISWFLHQDSCTPPNFQWPKLLPEWELPSARGNDKDFISFLESERVAISLLEGCLVQGCKGSFRNKYKRNDLALDFRIDLHKISVACFCGSAFYFACTCIPHVLTGNSSYEYLAVNILYVILFLKFYS